jgi:hypothetical protein
MTGEPGVELQSGLKALAQRIVEAARLAASAHLFESAPGTGQHHGRRVAIGGAGPDLSRDDGAAGAGRRTSGEAAVTDDDAAALPTRAAGPARPPRYSEAAD